MVDDSIQIDMGQEAEEERAERGEHGEVHEAGFTLEGYGKDPFQITFPPSPPRRARKSQEEPGGTRGSQEEPGC